MASISRVGLAVSDVFRRTAPDPLVIAILLSLLTALLAVTVGCAPPAGESWLASRPQAALRLFDAWRADDGIWKLLAFAMQMCLVLLAGHAVAASPAVRRVLERLAEAPRSTASAAALVGFIACVAGIVNWGLGLIVGAVLARDVGRSLARRGVRAHYPLICAAGYTAMMVWHGGLSGSAPLAVTSRANALKTMPAAQVDRLVGDGIPLSETLLSPLNLVVTAGLLVIVPVCLFLLAPRDESLMTPADPALCPRAPRSAEAPTTIPARLEQSRWVALALALPLAIAAGRFVALRGITAIGLNEVNAAMLALGLLLHGSPMRWLDAVTDGARDCAGIIVQFPLYAGIMAMLLASGLATTIAEGFTNAGSSRTIPLLSFSAACVLNMFIPSGGGQWAVQGPIALEAGLAAGIAPGRMVMTVAYGDQITNMLQPFWAVPLLAITGARAGALMGYTSLVMLAGGARVLACLIVM